MGLTDDLRRVQADLSRRTIIELLALWELLDPEDIAGTLERWLAAATSAVSARHAQSAALARAYYRAIRLEQLGSTLPAALPVPPLVPAAVRTSLTVTGPVQLRRALGRGVPIRDAAQAAAVASARAGSRQALEGGRETITYSVRSDPRARGWIRVTGGEPCDFCVMQAGRGAVYSATTVDFASHANCQCQPEPAFG